MHPRQHHTEDCRTGSMPSSALWKPYLADNVSVKPIYNLLWCQVRVNVIVLHAIAAYSVRNKGLETIGV